MAAITQGSNTTSFAYDALGRRYSRAAGGTTAAYQYAGDKVLLEKQGSTTTAAYFYGNALVRKDGEYPMFDELGSERTVTNSSQSVTGTLTCRGDAGPVDDMAPGGGAFQPGPDVAHARQPEPVPSLRGMGSTGSSSDPYMFAATSRYKRAGVYYSEIDFRFARAPVSNSVAAPGGAP